MKTIYYRRWEPSQSRVKVEFRIEVLQRLRSRRDSRGFLFGNREGDVLRVVAAGGEAPDQLETLGVYASRIRGEVFLTEADLEHTECVPDGIALVIAGDRAGFFTRGSNGSMQAVRSYEEFSIAAPAMPRTTRHPWLPPVNIWKRIALAMGLAAGPVVGMEYLRERMPTLPLEISLRESNGQLIIGWDRRLTADGGRLEISEGDTRSSFPLANDSSSATYLPKTGNVEVRLQSGDRMGTARWRTARYGR